MLERIAIFSALVRDLLGLPGQRFLRLLANRLGLVMLAEKPAEIIETHGLVARHRQTLPVFRIHAIVEFLVDRSDFVVQGPPPEGTGAKRDGRTMVARQEGH